MHERVVVPGLVLVGAVLVGIWLGASSITPARSSPAALGSAVTSTPPSVGGTEQRVVVHVSGWVHRPGLVEVPADARVADAVAAAGGGRPGARLDSMNLAAEVADGARVVVPGPDDPDIPASSAGGGEGAVPVRINHADAAELETLPGVGPVLAGRIIEHREREGPFRAPEDLLEVPGIGERVLESLRGHIQVP